jgi:hypothetical protein
LSEDEGILFSEAGVTINQDVILTSDGIFPLQDIYAIGLDYCGGLATFAYDPAPRYNLVVEFHDHGAVTILENAEEAVCARIMVAISTARAAYGHQHS